METTPVQTPAPEDPDSGQRGSGADEKFYVEEFKIFTGAMFDIDKRVAQVFGFAIAAAVSLLTWIAKFILENPAPPLGLAYASMIPNFLVLPAFFYLIAQRRDLIGFAAYVCLLENRLRVAGFQTGLGSGIGSLRASKHRGGESNDPIPYSFWALFVISAALFVHGIQLSGGSLCHLLVLVLPGGLLAYSHWKWKYLIPNVLPELIAMWKEWEAKRKTS